MNRHRVSAVVRLLSGVAVLAAFWALELYQYQLFHLFAEGFSIAVSLTVFILVLNVRKLVGFGPLIFLGYLSGGVGLLDFLHVIAFPTMGLFPGRGFNLAAQFWIVARGLEVLGFLTAFLSWSRPSPKRLIATLAVAGVLLPTTIVLIFTQQFPVMFVEGKGLTPLKVNLEYLYIAALLVCLGLLYRHRREMPGRAAPWFAMVLSSAVLAEVCFTLYVGPTDFFNVLGHFFKVVTYYGLYRVLIQHGLLAPYEGIFRRLQAANESLEATVEARTVDLQRNVQRLQTILSASPGPLLFLSPREGRVVCLGCNAAALETLGPLVEGEDLSVVLQRAGFAAQALIPPIAHYLATRQGDLPLDADLGSGDARRTFEITLYPLEETDAVAVFSDVTARRRAWEAYQLQDQVFQLSGDFILVLDQEGVIKLHNPAWLSWLELSAFDLVHRPWMDLIHPDDRHAAEEALSRLRAPTSASLELRMLGSSGLVRTVAWNLHPSPDLSLVYGVGREVTTERASEAMLRQASKWESLSLVAGGVAHDFNNMLAGMFGFVELARMHNREQRPDAVEAALDRSLQVFQRAKGLTRQLLAVSKGGVGTTSVVDLAPILRQAADFVLAGTACSLDWQLAEALGPCEVDTDQMFQAFQNLFLNALQAMEGAGTLHIRGRVQGGRVTVEVEDEGPGVPPEWRQRVFEPFFSSKASGTGLGLAIVASIASKHAGKVELIKGQGRGACFALWLPQSVRAPSADSEPLASDPSALLVVLLMEDDADIRDSLATALASWGHEVRVAAEGGEALAQARQARQNGRPVQVAVLDWTIRKGLGGAETLVALRRLEPELRIVVSTGYATLLPGDGGYDALLSKPFRLDELRHSLSAAH